MALHFAERKAGVEMYRDLGWIDRRVLGGIEHGRRDAVAVRDRIDMACAPTFARPLAVGLEVDALHDGRWVIAWSHHHRHAQRELAAVLLHRLLIFDLHQHRFARTDIGDRIGEDIRPLLLGQRGLLTVALGVLVDDAGLLPLLDVADDDAVADHHLERIDRASRRQRVDIGRLHPLLGRIAEQLGDSGANCRTRHGEVDIDAEPRRVGIAVVGLEEQRSGARVGRLEHGKRRFGRPSRFEAHEQSRKSDQERGNGFHQEEQHDAHLARQARASGGHEIIAGRHVLELQKRRF